MRITKKFLMGLKKERKSCLINMKMLVNSEEKMKLMKTYMEMRMVNMLEELKKEKLKMVLMIHKKLEK